MQKSSQKQRAERAILEKTNVFLEAFLDDTKTADLLGTIFTERRIALKVFLNLPNLCCYSYGVGRHDFKDPFLGMLASAPSVFSNPKMSLKE